MSPGGEQQPLYRKIYHSIRTEISTGRLAGGDRVPSEKELSVKFKVSRITSKRALELLASDGVIVRIPGKGSFVAGLGRGGAAGGGTRAGAGLIAAVIADFSASFGTEVLYAMEERCRELNLNLVLARSRDNADRETESIERLLSLHVDGIVVMPCHGEYYSETILRLVIDRYPLVFVDRFLPGLAASFVGTDNFDAAKKGVDYLFELGHRVVSFITLPPENTSTIEERLDGFVRSHAERRIRTDRSLWLTGVRSPMYHNSDGQIRHQDVETVKAHLAAHPEITAAFADEYNVATIVRQAAKELGKSVPADLSILSFDCPTDKGAHPAFTHLRQQEGAMGTQAIDLLCEQMRDRERIEKRRLPAELVIGDSTCKVRV